MDYCDIVSSMNPLKTLCAIQGIIILMSDVCVCETLTNIRLSAANVFFLMQRVLYSFSVAVSFNIET